MIYAFIDHQRAAGRSVESVCEVLTSVGIQAAARSYRRARAAGAVLAGQVLALAYLAMRSTPWRSGTRARPARSG